MLILSPIHWIHRTSMTEYNLNLASLFKLFSKESLCFHTIGRVVPRWNYTQSLMVDLIDKCRCFE